MPFCKISQNKNGTISAEYSMEIQILKILEVKYNFKSKLLDAKQMWGTLVNGTWNGMVAQILNNVGVF